MIRKSKTRDISSRQSRLYLAKAMEFRLVACEELARGRWTTAGLAAVHAGISATDAVTVAVAGTVNASADHAAAVSLLRECMGDRLSGVTERQIVGLLKLKSEIAYGQRSLAESNARTLVYQATRYVAWAEGVVGD